MYRDDFLQKKLNNRKANHSLRQLQVIEGKTDFCSNDYLGIVRNGLLNGKGSQMATGSTGSRLLSGNNHLAESVEKQVALFHQTEAALLFNSGYDANIGLLASVPNKEDTILYDQLCHASIRDGIRLSFARSFSFLHNDMHDLEQKLSNATGTVFIVTESVFSMDGDYCPLPELVTIARQWNAHLIIDEAHATGVVGEKGEGLVQHYQMQGSVFARMHSFGKACGCHGAAIVGSNALREYLVNFARSFLYTTALPPHALELIKESYLLIPSLKNAREHLKGLIHQFRAASIPFPRLDSVTPIQIVIIPGNEPARLLAAVLQQKGLDVRAILYPTVPKGMERLRIVLHAFNSKEELGILLDTLNGG